MSNGNKKDILLNMQRLKKIVDLQAIERGN
jgi:hypothetical protein